MPDQLRRGQLLPIQVILKADPATKPLHPRFVPPSRNEVLEHDGSGISQVNLELVAVIAQDL